MTGLELCVTQLGANWAPVIGIAAAVGLNRNGFPEPLRQLFPIIS